MIDAHRSFLFALAVAGGLAAAPAVAAAQGRAPMIDPSGDEPPAEPEPTADDGAMAPPNPYAPPGQNQRAPMSAPPAQGGGNNEGSGVETGYYHADDYGGAVEEAIGPEGATAGGQAPSVHVVQRGDTLWDVSIQYFNSPWEWPKVWSYNPEITNPHWIYPGNQVRLRAAGSAPVAPAGDAPAGTAHAAASGQGGLAPLNPSDEIVLRQVAFVDADQLRYAGKVDGSPDEKALLSRGDEAYLAYPRGNPPKAGQRHSIYQTKRLVKHPKTGEVVGAYVRVLGELDVLSVKKDKRARALITDSVGPIERGDHVGPLRQRFTSVSPTDAKADAQATILEVLDADQLIGARQVVFLDKGASEGVAVGNRLYVVRRGDAYSKVMGPNTNIGKDDRRFPARALGELMVIDAGKHTSLAIVTVSVQELGIGDHVVLSRGVN